VKRMCRTAILLERGEVLLQGTPNDVTNIYTKLITSPHGVESIRADLLALKNQPAQSPSLAPAEPASCSPNLDQSVTRPGPAASLLSEERAHQQISDKEYSYGGESGQITRVALTDEHNQPRLSFLTGGRIRVKIACRARQVIADPIYALTLKDIRGQEIYGTNTYFQNQTPPSVPAGNETAVVFELQLNVQPGVYFISLGWVRLVNAEVEVIHRRYDVLRFDVLPCDKSFGLAYCPTSISVGPLP
jgi:lipopolysaccharide transport system ATP-binding protein